MEALLAGYGSDGSSSASRSSSSGNRTNGADDDEEHVEDKLQEKHGGGKRGSENAAAAVPGPNCGKETVITDAGFPEGNATANQEDEETKMALSPAPPLLSLALPCSSSSLIGCSRDSLAPLQRSASSSSLIAKLRRAHQRVDEKLDRILSSSSLSPSRHLSAIADESRGKKRRRGGEESRDSGSGSARSEAAGSTTVSARVGAIDSGSYARFLQSDHDFLNPNQLAAAAARLGIRNALSSTLEFDDDCDIDEGPAS
jgi:hypothetical protein